MTRSEWAAVLLSIRRKYPVSAAGVAAEYGIEPYKHTVRAHIERNKAIRRAWRNRGFA